MGDPITIGYGQNKWVKDANTQGLSFAGMRTTIGSTVLYTCPAGKKFTVLNVMFSLGGDVYYSNNYTAQILCNGSSKAMVVRYGDSSSTGAQFITTQQFSMYSEISAGQTIILSTIGSMDAAEYPAASLSIFGVEENA